MGIILSLFPDHNGLCNRRGKQSEPNSKDSARMLIQYAKWPHLPILSYPHLGTRRIIPKLFSKVGHSWVLSHLYYFLYSCSNASGCELFHFHCWDKTGGFLIHIPYRLLVGNSRSLLRYYQWSCCRWNWSGSEWKLILFFMGRLHMLCHPICELLTKCVFDWLGRWNSNEISALNFVGSIYGLLPCRYGVQCTNVWHSMQADWHVYTYLLPHHEVCCQSWMLRYCPCPWNYSCEDCHIDGTLYLWSCDLFTIVPILHVWGGIYNIWRCPRWASQQFILLHLVFLPAPVCHWWKLPRTIPSCQSNPRRSSECPGSTWFWSVSSSRQE